MLMYRLIITVLEALTNNNRKNLKTLLKIAIIHYSTCFFF